MNDSRIGFLDDLMLLVSPLIDKALAITSNAVPSFSESSTTTGLLIVEMLGVILVDMLMLLVDVLLLCMANLFAELEILLGLLIDESDMMTIADGLLFIGLLDSEALSLAPATSLTSSGQLDVCSVPIVL
jgi:hypothetical protein